MSTHPAFTDLDAHVLRVGYNTLLDIPLDATAGAQVWVATIWPDASQPGGWGRLVWSRHPKGRGWLIEPLTHLGDVVEFGADHDGTLDRWYGYVSQADAARLVLVGPYVHPVAALEDGESH
jgi:hypothetical protein